MNDLGQQPDRTRAREVPLSMLADQLGMAGRPAGQPGASGVGAPGEDELLGLLAKLAGLAGQAKGAPPNEEL